MTRQTDDLEILELRSQARAAREAAETADPKSKDLVHAAAATIDSVARSLQRRNSAAQDPIEILDPDASSTEVRRARQLRAVRQGEKIFLPSWRDATVALPNSLLRSALFSAGARSQEALFEKPIAAQGDVVLTFTGHQLCGYDRRVFAACLNHYRDERPLASESNTDAAWVKISFWRFAQDLEVEYGRNVHQAIRESLVRLNAAHLRIRLNRRDVPMPRLLEVAFEDGYLGHNSHASVLLGGDEFSFRVFESMANLFGPAGWTAVCHTALNGHSGLMGWLISFYSTHAKPYPVALKDLYKNSGATCEFREFRRLLKTALTRLQSSKVTPEVRVDSFVLEKSCVTVHLSRWQKS